MLGGDNITDLSFCALTFLTSFAFGSGGRLFFGLDGKKSVESALLFRVQEFLELFGALAYSFFAMGTL